MLPSVFAVGVLIILAAGESDAAKENLEYRVKAAFLYNLAKFAEWPIAVFPDTEAPVVVGVLSNESFRNTLEETLRGKLVGGRKVEVKSCATVGSARSSQVLFIGESETARLSEIVNDLGRYPVLTVSDIEDFARRGGMVCLAKRGNKIRLEVNVTRTRRAQVKLSSKVLKLATIIQEESE